MIERSSGRNLHPNNLTEIIEGISGARVISETDIATEIGLMDGNGNERIVLFGQTVSPESEESEQ